MMLVLTGWGGFAAQVVLECDEDDAVRVEKTEGGEEDREGAHDHDPAPLLPEPEFERLDALHDESHDDAGWEEKMTAG